ncbi:MAG: hypothetical protein KDD38_04575, partial [Bdellovibrionales bacterium]|nr:hypothetical protein [Bdellovibrionales bacterium]
SDTNAAELDLNFQYSAEILTAANGEFRLRTIIPGAYPASDTWIRPPHIHLRIEKRGFHELTTQLYFDRFRELNQKDLILKDLPSEQQSRLVMSQRFAEEGDDDLGLVSFRYDVELSVRQVSNS